MASPGALSLAAPTRRERGLSAIARGLGVVGPRGRSLMARAIAFVAGRVLRIRRREVEASMVRAGLPPAAALAMYGSLAESLVELLAVTARPETADAVLADRVVLDGPAMALLRERARSGGGVVVGATHTGNWDLAACAVAAVVPLLVVTKRLSVRWLDAFWQRSRARLGVSLVEPVGAFATARAHLGAGGAVAMMIDQVPARARHGLRAPFLGEEAWLDRAPATLAARAGVPFVVAASHRRRDGRVAVHALGMLDPPPRAGSEWIDAATRQAAAWLEEHVRRHPASWLWLHRRWKDLA